MKWTLAGVFLLTIGVGLAAPAAADPDSTFAEELHTYGIYGQKDYNAWIGKILCKRLDNNVDHNAYESARFVHANLDKTIWTRTALQNSRGNSWPRRCGRTAPANCRSWKTLRGSEQEERDVFDSPTSGGCRDSGALFHRYGSPHGGIR